MSAWRGCAKLRNKQTPNPPPPRTGSAVASAQRSTPRAQLQLSKMRWMTISTFLLRSVFCSNPFVKPIARWIKTKWTRLRHAHGWSGGNGSTLFWILKLRLTSPFHTKWHSWQNNARTHDGKRTGNGATNCASGSLRSAGKCATRKTGQSSRAALEPRSTDINHIAEPLIDVTKPGQGG